MNNNNKTIKQSIFIYI